MDTATSAFSQLAKIANTGLTAELESPIINELADADSVETPPPVMNVETAPPVQVHLDNSADPEFQATHPGFTREEWDELMQWLRDSGLGAIADYAEAHPEDAAPLLRGLLDGNISPDDSRLWTLAYRSYADDYADRQAVLDKILAALGLTYVGDVQGMRIYQGRDGKYYAVVGINENGVDITEVYGYDRGYITWERNPTHYALNDPRLGLSPEEIGAFASVSDRMQGLFVALEAYKFNQITEPSRPVSNPEVDGAQNLDDGLQYWLDTIRRGGLTEEEWNNFLQYLRDHGLGEVADHLASHPEDLPEVLAFLSDPQGYVDRVRAGATDDYNADAARRNAVFDRIAASFGWTFYGEYDGVRVYTDGNGHYYAITDRTGSGNPYQVDVSEVDVSNAEQTGKVIWRSGGYYNIYDLDDPRFGFSPANLEAFETAKWRSDHAVEGIARRLGLSRETVDRILDSSPEDRAYFAGIQGRTFIMPDGSYVDEHPRLQLILERIRKLLNLLAALMMLVEARAALKKIVFEIAADVKIEEGKVSVMDIYENRRAAVQTVARYYQTTITRYINSHNSRQRALELQEADRRARREADNGWNLAGDFFTLGQGDFEEKDYRARKEGYQAEVEERWGAASRRRDERHAHLSEILDLDSGDPFGAKIDGLVGGVGANDFVRPVGGGLVEMDPAAVADPLTGGGRRDKLIALENLRKLYYVLRQAKQKLRQLVYEITSGRSLGASNDQVALSALADLEQFEQKVFADAVNIARDLMNAANAAAGHRREEQRWQEAYDNAVESLYHAGPLPFPGIGPLFPVSDAVNGYLNGESPENYGNFDSDPEEAARRIMWEITQLVAAAKSEQAKDILTAEEQAARGVERLDREMARVYHDLGGKDIIEWHVDDDGDRDGFSNLNEKRVNELRDRFTALQNMQRMLVMLTRAKGRLKEIVMKVAQGLAAELPSLLGPELVDPTAENKQLAFELKLTNIRYKIQENNQRRQAELRREQARWKFVGVVVGSGLAAGGLYWANLALISWAGAGFAVAMVNLGMALGNMIFHWRNPIAGASGSRPFYDVVEDPAKYSVRAGVLEAIERLERQQKYEIDRAERTGKDFAVKAGESWLSADQWALDSALLLDLSDALKKLQLMEKTLVMLVEAQLELQKIVRAAATGVAAADDSDFVKAGLQSAQQARKQSLELKQEMYRDIISARNMKAQSDAEFVRSAISFGISAAGAAAGAAAASNWWNPGGLTGAQGAMKGLEIAGYVSAAWNLTLAISDTTADNKLLTYEAALLDIINRIYEASSEKTLKRAAQSGRSLKEQERAIVSDVSRQGLLIDYGGGNLGVDAAAFYRLKDKLERLYNVEIARANLVQGWARFRKLVAAKAGLAGGRGDELFLEAVYQQKEASEGNLELLRSRLQDFSERENQLNNIWKNLYITVAVSSLVAFQAYSKYSADLKSLLSKLFNIELKGQNISLENRITAWLHETFGSQGIVFEENSIGDKIMKIAVGGDGQVSAGDLAGVLYKAFLSQEFARLLATITYNNTVEDKAGERVEKSKWIANRGSASTSQLDTLENMAVAEERASGSIENEGSINNVRYLLDKEDNFFWQLSNIYFREIQAGAGLVRQTQEQGAAVVRALTELIEAATKSGDVNSSTEYIRQLEISLPAMTDVKAAEAARAGLEKAAAELERTGIPGAEGAAQAAKLVTRMNVMLSQLMERQLSRVSDAALPAAAQPEFEVEVRQAAAAMAQQQKKALKPAEILLLKIKMLSQRAAALSQSMATEVKPQLQAVLNQLKQPLRLALRTLINNVTDKELKGKLENQFEKLKGKTPLTIEAAIEAVLLLETAAGQANLPELARKNIADALASLKQVVVNQKLAEVVVKELVSPGTTPEQIAAGLLAKAKKAGANGTDLTVFILTNIEQIKAAVKTAPAVLIESLKELRKLVKNNPAAVRAIDQSLKQISAPAAALQSETVLDLIQSNNPNPEEVSSLFARLNPAARNKVLGTLEALVNTGKLSAGLLKYLALNLGLEPVVRGRLLALAAEMELPAAVKEEPKVKVEISGLPQTAAARSGAIATVVSGARPGQKKRDEETDSNDNEPAVSAPQSTGTVYDGASVQAGIIRQLQKTGFSV